MTLEEQRERVRVLSNGAFKLESKTHLKHGDKCVMVCSKGHKIETLWKDLGKKLSSETFCNDCYMLAKMDKRAKEKGYKLLSKSGKVILPLTPLSVRTITSRNTIGNTLMTKKETIALSATT